MEKFKKNIFEWMYERPLPDFLIIGAQKSGTTGLHHYLEQHSQLYSAKQKEIHYFSGGLSPEIDNYSLGQRWYRKHFPKKNSIDKSGLVFEASPIYLFNPLAPERIYQLIPNCKLIVLLRNPVERAISHYFHEKRLGIESLDIMKALLSEEDRLKRSLKNNDYKSLDYIHYSYKLRGHYKEQLVRYFKYFPRKNVLIIQSEKLFSDTEKTLKNCFEFLNIQNNYKISDIKPRGVSRLKKDSQVRPDVYQYLNDYFKYKNEDLYGYLGKNFEW